ncbi:MAG: tyrosine-type recombinase/integrase [Promethearchaeota archaeon]
MGEVAGLSLGEIDLVRRRLLIHDGKGGKDRISYLSDDVLLPLDDYLTVRRASTTQKVFLVEKGTYRDGPLSIRALQKRMEYYAKKTGLKVSCHHLRHTMATQMQNRSRCRIFWATNRSLLRSVTATSPTVKSRDTITRLWRWSCKG